MSEPIFSPTTEYEYDRLPQVYRDADEEQVYPLKIDEVKERFNYAHNPSFEVGGESRIGAINEITNPSFEGDTSGTAEVYRNIVTNPQGKTNTANTVVVRKNLVNRSLIVGANGTMVQLGANEATGCDIATPGSLDGGVVRFPVPTADLVNGSTYTFSVEVHNPNSTSIAIELTWGTSGLPTEITLAPNETRRIDVTGTESIYLESNSQGRLKFYSGTGQLYFCKALIEHAGGSFPYFDGSTAVTDPDLTPAWVGTPNESYSVLMGVEVKGWQGVNGVVYWSQTTGKAKLFVPFIGTAGAKAQSDGSVTNDPVTAMARVYTSDGTQWMAKYDGAYPYPAFKDPAGETITELQYPVVGGTEPPQDSFIGQYWVNDQNAPYRRIQ